MLTAPPAQFSTLLGFTGSQAGLELTVPLSRTLSLGERPQDPCFGFRRQEAVLNLRRACPEPELRRRLAAFGTLGEFSGPALVPSPRVPTLATSSPRPLFLFHSCSLLIVQEQRQFRFWETQVQIHYTEPILLVNELMAVGPGVGVGVIPGRVAAGGSGDSLAREVQHNANSW